MLWLVLGACAGGPSSIGAQPSWRHPAAAPAPTALLTAVASAAPRPPATPLRFVPTSEPAASYNEPLEVAPHTPLNDAVITAVGEAAARAGVTAPVADARLFRACADLAAIVPEDGIIDYKAVEFALQRNGIIEPALHLLVLWNVLDSPDQIVQQLSPRLAEYLAGGSNARLGVGAARRHSDGSGAVVFLLQGSAVSTAPIPRTVGAGGVIAIDAAIDPRYHDPEVFVTRDDGTTQRYEIAAAQHSNFTLQISCGARTGRQQIEIVAADALGSTVLANFPVWCAAQPPAAIAVDASHDDAPATSAEATERALFAAINRDRIAAALPALQWDDQLAEVARGYAEEMRRTRIIAHVSPTSGSVADRVRAAHIKTGLVLENLARAYSIDDAHDSLMNSPGHRANLLSSAATHLGVGIALGDDASGRRELFIAQVFTRVPPTLDRAAALEAVRHKLEAVRPVRLRPELGDVAQRLADELASGRSRDDAAEVVKRSLDRLTRIYLRFDRTISVTADLDTLDGAGLLGGAAGDDLGIGIAQGAHAEIGGNAIWIVVLLGTRRG